MSETLHRNRTYKNSVCRTLREYSEFVTRIRRYTVGETAIEEAVDRAVTECIAEGILAEKRK